MSKFNNLSLNDEDVVDERIKIYIKSSEILNKGYKKHLHTLEPTGIRMLRTTIIRGIICDTTMDLYAHNGEDIRFLRRVLPNHFSYIGVEGGDTLLLDISKTITPIQDPIKTYQFIFVFYRNSYEITPIFDIRNNKKVSEHATQDEKVFKSKVLSDVQKEKGMSIISENIRLYISKCKYIPKNFKPIEMLNYYESVIKSYNELGGFDDTSKKKELQSRKQHIFLTDITNQPDFIEVNSQRISVKPELIFFYFNDFQGMINTFNLLFDPWWNLNNEWTSMYPKYFIEKTKEFKLIWRNSREEFENNNLKNIYENYFILNYCNMSQEVTILSNLKIYFLITLQELLGADFISKTEILFRKNPRSQPRNKYEYFLQGIEYIIFAISKNYAVNVLSYASMYGFCICDQLIINKIIDNSKNMFFYIPRNENFKIYENTSIPVTLKTLYIDEGVLTGMASSNSEINIKLNKDKFYQTNTNSEGKFQFQFPISLQSSDIICVTSIEQYKIESVAIIISPSSRLEDNIIKFLGGGDYEVTKIMFDTSKNELKVTSTGIEANIQFSSEEYISFALLNLNGDIKAQAYILGKDNADEFSKILSGVSFEYSDEIMLFYEERGRVIISNFEGKEIYHPKEKDYEIYKVQPDGLILSEN